ncbi:50S ribosomal protein L29 [Candidatus Woesearchaeota archaeon]|nr:50S ribosomal protein L29 [Candidatus Woesearchaeota archaeon]
MVKKKELWSMNREEMEKQLDNLKMELIKANSQVASGTAPKSPGQIRQSKKTIARILTILKNKEKTKEEKKKHE